MLRVRVCAGACACACACACALWCEACACVGVNVAGAFIVVHTTTCDGSLEDPLLFFFNIVANCHHYNKEGSLSLQTTHVLRSLTNNNNNTTTYYTNTYLVWNDGARSADQ